MTSTPQADVSNWFRFDGSSTEPEWDTEDDVDEVIEDDYSEDSH
jgi:hypothetical protein